MNCLRVINRKHVCIKIKRLNLQFSFKGEEPQLILVVVGFYFEDKGQLLGIYSCFGPLNPLPNTNSQYLSHRTFSTVALNAELAKVYQKTIVSFFFLFF